MGRPLDRSWRPWGELLAVQEANLGRQMNLIELLEGVLGTSRALPPPFGRVPGGPEGAKVVPWSDFGEVSGGPRHLMNAQMGPRYPLGPFQAPKSTKKRPPRHQHYEKTTPFHMANCICKLPYHSDLDSGFAPWRGLRSLRTTQSDSRVYPKAKGLGRRHRPLGLSI